MNELHVGTGPLGPDAPRPLRRALCAPYQNHRSLVALPKLQMAPKPILLISSGSRKKEPVGTLMILVSGFIVPITGYGLPLI